METSLEKFKREATLYINNSNWLLDECDKIIEEFKLIDTDTCSVEYMNDLIVRMDYLQGKIHSEQRLYDNFVEENERFIDE